jgi:GTP diphosphokinase / guanosine-3',5'-bis(diphosphate) 3'-diphosphatase
VSDTNSLVHVLRAVDFAARQHAKQRRKGEAAEPYVNHLTEVALLVAEATEGKDPVAVMAAVLHDTVEDTGLSSAELAAAFGPEVAALVAEVTDDKSLEKAERKRLQIEHAPHISPQAKLVKMADKISNLRAIRSSPPPWDDARKRAYLDWARQVVEGCRAPLKGAAELGTLDAAIQKLGRIFDETHEAGMAHLTRVG